MALAYVFVPLGFVPHTETTGLDDEAEIVEIALVDHAGQVVFESYCKPSKAKTDPKAFEVHGIGDEALANAPSCTSCSQYSP